MEPLDSHEMNLAAPCGMYCGACRHYLAREKGLLEEWGLKSGCEGCRIRNKNCVWVRKGCALLRKNQIAFCYECGDFPCAKLEKLDESYSRDYNISFIDNLLRIKEVGAEQWLDEQKHRWRCSECGGEVCIHDRECYDCGCKVD